MHGDDGCHESSTRERSAAGAFLRRDLGDSFASSSQSELTDRASSRSSRASHNCCTCTADSAVPGGAPSEWSVLARERIVLPPGLAPALRLSSTSSLISSAA